MAASNFSMHTQKAGRVKYLLLTMIPPILLMWIGQQLALRGVLTQTLLIVWLPMALMIILMYFMILRKNHKVDVKGHMIIETSWRGNEICRFKAKQIRAVRQNFLKEIILLDENGKKLLCVESNMSNFQLFEQWLRQYINIQLKERN